MWSNIKTIIEEHMSSGNVTTGILLVDDHDKVSVCAINKKTGLNKPKLFKK